MALYSLVLFVHVTAVLIMFAALSFEALSLFHLRRASNFNEARLWLEPLPGLPLVAAGSLLGILVSGIYLTVKLSAFGMAWPKVSIAAFLLMAPLGGLTAKRIRTIRRVNVDAQAFNSALLQRLQDPTLKISLGIRIAVFLGIVLLMVAKPGWRESLGIVAGSAILGFLLSILPRYGSGLLSNSSSHLGS